jgi:hypothetical protein
MAIGTPQFRYKFAAGLLVCGLGSLISLLPLSLVLWGSPLGFLGPIIFVAGALSVLAATLLGLFNYYSLRATQSNSSPAETKE